MLIHAYSELLLSQFSNKSQTTSLSATALQDKMLGFNK